MAGISYVFTITRVAKMLGEDEDWLHEICIEMDPEDGRLTVLGPGEEAITAFTRFGVDNLTELVKIYKADPDLRSTVSDSPIPLFRWLDFFVGLSANASRPRDYAARRSAERCAAQPQGMSSSRRDAGQRLTSFVSTSAK